MLEAWPWLQSYGSLPPGQCVPSETFPGRSRVSTASFLISEGRSIASSLGAFLTSPRKLLTKEHRTLSDRGALSLLSLDRVPGRFLPDPVFSSAAWVCVYLLGRGGSHKAVYAESI